MEGRDNMSHKISIAIDGPSGVGKSSVAKAIAQKLHYTFINTGLMYRGLAYVCLQNNIDLENENQIMDFIETLKIEMFPNEIITVNDQDITSLLWVDKISLAASQVAKWPLIRRFCVKKQQEIARKHNGVIMEGRDIGSVVLKDAQLKIFLEANNETRVKRRVKQLLEKGQKVNSEEVLKNIIERDKRDLEREITPLIKVPEAISIDTSNLSLNEVINMIINLAKEKENEK